MKKILTILIVLFAIQGYSQSVKDFKIRNSLTLKDSTVNGITSGNTLATQEYVDENAFVQPLDSVSLDTNTISITANYTLYADTAENTISFKTGLGSTAQIARESLIKVYNGTSDTIEDGKVLCACGLFNGTISVEKAIATDRYTALLWGTTTILPNSYGDAVVLYGTINDINNSSLSLGQAWLSATDSGDVVNTPPSFPNYVYSLGAATKIGALDGKYEANLSGVSPYNTTVNFHNGTFREPFDFRVISDGTTIKGYIEPTDGHPDLTAMLSDGLFTFDTSPADTIVLNAGTDDIFQTNYVYVLQSTKLLTVSTSGFPTTEYIPVAVLELASPSLTVLVDAIRNQNINNFIQRVDNNMGMLHTIGDRIRIMDAVWGRVGCEATLSGTPSNLYASVTEGIVYQMSRQTYIAKDMSGGDIAFIVNDPIKPYDTTSNFNTITTDALGGSINNVWTNIVLWGVANKSGEISQLMCNLPTGTYNSESNAVDDLLNYSVYDIPDKFRGVGFLIGRFTFRKSGTTYTYNPSVGYLDLRGKFPNTTVGVGGGSSGITSFLGLTDTESSYTPYEFQVVNSAGTALESPSELTLNDSLKLSNGNLIINDTAKIATSIGIGTSSPLVKFHMSGNSLLSPTSGVTSPMFVSTSDAYASEFKGDGSFTGFLVSNSKAGGAGIPFVQFYNIVNTDIWTMQLESNDRLNIREGSATGTEIFTILSGGNIGIGTATPSERLEVDGNITGDSIGIGIKDPITALHINNGEIKLGNNSTGFAAISVADTFSILNRHSFDDYSVINSNIGGLGYGVFDASTKMIGSNNEGHFNAYQSRLDYSSSGTMPYMIGLLVDNEVNSGTITDNYGLHVYDITGSGTIINNYGLYLENYTKGTSINYSLYVAANGKSYLGGDLELNQDLILDTDSEISGKLQLIGASPHSIKDGNGFVWTADGLTGTYKAGIVGNANTLRLFAGNTISSPQLMILENGNIGINDELPTYNLDVNGTGRFTGIVNFDVFPVTPSSPPTTDYQVANKKYVDDNAISLTGIMQVARAQILYTNTTQTTIVTLPTGAVISNIGVNVTTAFNDSGTDFIEVGTTADDDRYILSGDASNTLFDDRISGDTMAILNLPDEMTGSTNITFTYKGQNTDATQGAAYVYIHYTEY